MMRRYRNADHRAGWLVSLLLAILVLIPLLAVIVQVIMPGGEGGSWRFRQLELLLEVFKRPLWQKSLSNSIMLAIGTAFLGTLLGAGLAIMRSHRTFPTARWLDIAVWIILITPSFILAQGWVLFAAGNGIAAAWLRLPFVTAVLFQPAGLIFIMTLSKFPFAYLAVKAALEWNADTLSHAARLAGASRFRTWRTVRLPLLKPAIGAGAIMVFMDTIGDFGLPASIAAVYRFPTLPYSIYNAIYTSPIRFDLAGVLSFYLVLIISLAITVQFYILRKARYDHLSAASVRTQHQAMGSKGWLAALCNSAFIFIALGIPIGSTLLISFVHSFSEGWTMSNWTFSNYLSLFGGHTPFLSSFSRSLRIAAAAACFGLCIGVLVSYVIIFTRSAYNQVIEAMSLIALAVPGVVLGIGYIFVWNQPWLEPFGLMLYGEPSILIAAGVAGAIPITTRMLAGSMASVPRAMLDAAQLQGMPLTGRILTILVPICRGALLRGVDGLRGRYVRSRDECHLVPAGIHHIAGDD